MKYVVPVLATKAYRHRVTYEPEHLPQLQSA
jgi:hypothetical protein